MRRDDATLSVEGVDRTGGDDPRRPALVIEVTGSTAELSERLHGPDGSLLDGSETDVAFRLHEPLDEGVEGVVGLTDRLTGDFVLEVNAPATDVVEFVQAARRFGETTADNGGRYEVRVRADDEELVSYRKGTFLVYDDEGSLLRQHSLIPSGVEL